MASIHSPKHSALATSTPRKVAIWVYFMVWIRFVYHQIIYWLVGTTPEAHHWNMAISWYDLERYSNCIYHCQEYLKYNDSDHLKVLMAHCFGLMAQWKEAASSYRSISDIWSQPVFALGLAEAELRCGNIQEARSIVTTVEVDNPKPPYELAISLEQLINELENSQ